MPAIKGNPFRNAGVAALLGLACMSASALAQDIRIAHAKGETILKARPAKAAVFDLATLDNLQALGVDAVAGVPKGAEGRGNFPSSLAGYGDTKYQNVGTLFEPDMAALMALKPDLILIAGRSSKNFDKLAAVAPTIDMSSADKPLAAVVKDNVTTLGRIFGVSDRAKARLARFDVQMAGLHAQAAKAGTGLLLFVAGRGANVQAPGDRFGHVYDFIGMRAAVEPAAPAKPGPRPAADSPEATAARTEQQAAMAAALTREPDWLIVLDRAAATGAPPSPIAERLAADDRIAATRAWKAGRVIYLDPKTWYLVGAGVDSLSASASDILATLRAGGQ